MAVNKKTSFTDDQQQLAEMAKALSHPARLAILQLLAEKETCICGQIVEVLPLAQATVSQHLKELKQAGLVKGEIDGPRSCYCIDWDNFNRFRALLDSFSKKIGTFQPKQNCC